MLFAWRFLDLIFSYPELSISSTVSLRFDIIFHVCIRLMSLTIDVLLKSLVFHNQIYFISDLVRLSLIKFYFHVQKCFHYVIQTLFSWSSSRLFYIIFNSLNIFMISILKSLFCVSTILVFFFFFWSTSVELLASGGCTFLYFFFVCFFTEIQASGILTCEVIFFFSIDFA